MAWTDEVIRKGDKGDLVLNVQQGLLFLGYDCGPADGIYGAKTLSAIQAFQRANGLGVDGICGPLTGKKLEAVYWAKAKANPDKAPIKPEPAKAGAAVKTAVGMKAGAAPKPAAPSKPAAGPTKASVATKMPPKK